MRFEQARVALADRLQARRDDIEQAVLARVYSISDPSDVSDPIYADGLRTAVAAALDYGLAAIASVSRRHPPVPAVALIQSGLAARCGVPLDTVLRRYFAGYTLLGQFLVDEANDAGMLGGDELKSTLRVQATLFDRLLTAVSTEYTRELEASRPVSAEQRRGQLVKRLLQGELLDTSEVLYDFDGHQLGAIATGPGADEALRDLSTALDRRLLAVRRDESTVWAWFGAQRPIDTDRLTRLLPDVWPSAVKLALGEPGMGLTGWRLTHRQAAAALPIALRVRGSVVSYGDVALLASILQDDLLATSLRQLYLIPLERERDGGEALRNTLRAYFAAGRNVSSAAAALGLSRQAVAKRLLLIEKRLACSLEKCGMELEASLRFDELSRLHADN